MISWQTAQTLIIFFGPWLLPRLLAFYRSIRYRPASMIKPLPMKASYALWILFLSASVAFLSTLPAFAEENIYRLTSSRLQTPASVLLTRLKALRPLTPADQKLKDVLTAGGFEAALRYLRFGPDVLVNIPFVEAGEKVDDWDYLLYAAPSILTPHLLHLFALGVATSEQLCGKEGARWRTAAAIAGILLATVELWVVVYYDDTSNARALRISDVDFVHWKLQVWRGIGIAVVDAILGWVVWLQATGRAFVSPPSASERLVEHGKVLEGLFNRTRGLGVVRNGALRDPAMRAKMYDYWAKDGEVTRDLFEDPAVLEAQRAVLKRLDIGRTSREAGEFVENILGGVPIVRP